MKLWGITNAGMEREINQDCYLLSVDDKGERAYCAICDGMGGAAAGEVASKTALGAFSSNIEKDGPPSFTARDMEKIIRSAVENANERVFSEATQTPEHDGMGTTIVCMLAAQNHVAIGNVGDSRAYIIDDSGIRQITSDHSLVNEMLQRGEITVYQAQRHPSRNVITRVLGVEGTVECDVFRLTVQPGQYILLCSDGLTNEVSEPEIYYEIFFSEQPENACKALVDIANSRGGHDNITVVLALF